jgi:aspartate carbamoyltransferase regulatory subunit
MSCAQDSTPLRLLSIRLENLMCRMNIHTSYCKYDMSTTEWKNMGIHCQYCDKPLSNKGSNWYRFGLRK